MSLPATMPCHWENERPVFASRSRLWPINANAIKVAGFGVLREFCAVLPRRYTPFSIARV
jgi:hypothetical protein